MTTNITFPEDQGTGAPEGDAIDAGTMASYNDNPNSTDYVVRGLGFTPDYTNLTLDLGAGKAFISTLQSVTATITGQTRDQGVTFLTEVAPRTGLSLTDGAINHVFLSADLTASDTVTVTINTTDTAPSDPALKIGTVDTTNDTVSLLNRDPSGSFRQLQVNGSTTLSDGSEAASRAWALENVGANISNNGLEVTSSATDLDFTANLIAADDGDGTSTITLDQGAGSGLDADTVDGIQAQDLGSDVSDDGTQVTNSATDLDFTRGVTAVGDGDGTSTISIDDIFVENGGDTMSGDLGMGNNDVSNARTVTAGTGLIVGNTLSSTESLTIGSDQSMHVAGTYNVNGTLVVDGALTVTGEISSSSSISGAGEIRVLG